MIHNSVRRKVTFWYTFVIMLLIIGVISILLAAMSVSNNNSKEENKDRLSDSVRQVIEEFNLIKNKNDKFQPSDNKRPLDPNAERPPREEEPPKDKENMLPSESDMQNAITNFVTYKNGVNFIIYDESGNVIKGDLPEDISDELPFEENRFTEYSSHNTDYIIYDSLMTKKVASSTPSKTSLQTYRIRGITTLDTDDLFIRKLILYSIIIIPFLAIIASVIGYRITKTAFKPIKQITDMAHSIAESGDLTKRIGLKSKDGKTDELQVMANTFDEMLETIEDQFEVRKRFTDDASHELRTPISVILGQCELAENEKADKEQIKSSLAAIKRQSKKMSKLVSQLLLFARIDKGKQNLNIEEINLSETVEIVVLELSEDTNEKNIKISPDIEPGISFRCDQTMITRLIINLVTNAVKYGKQNGHVNISLVKNKKEITLKVVDDGIGIAKENIDKVWERFFRADPSRTSSDDSSGLGLSISQWIVEAHGGIIAVESELGLGSTFTVTFPTND